MPSRTLPFILLTLLTTPLSTLAAVIPCTTCQKPGLGVNEAFGLNYFQGSDNEPCTAVHDQAVLHKEMVFTPGYCFSAAGPTTCIGRRLDELHSQAGTLPDRDGWILGFDATPYNCTVLGYQQNGCPAGTGTAAQYNATRMAWSWDHETRISDFGGLWAIQSFQMSCTQSAMAPRPLLQESSSTASSEFDSSSTSKPKAPA